MADRQKVYLQMSISSSYKIRNLNAIIVISLLKVEHYFIK